MTHDDTNLTFSERVGAMYGCFLLNTYLLRYLSKDEAKQLIESLSPVRGFRLTSIAAKALGKTWTFGDNLLKALP